MNDLIERIKSNFPKELQDLNQWVLWRMETRNDKPTKVPYSIVTGLRAASDNPSTWASFDAVCKAYQAGGYAGLGYMFHESDPYTGIDFDKCVGERLDPEKFAHIDLLDSYTEYSQSGTGVHVIVRAKLPAGGRKSREHLIEMYDHKRFFCVTGNNFENFTTSVKERQSELDTLYALIFPPKAANAHANATTTPSGEIPADDQDLLKLMFASKTGAKVQALWDGNRSGYSDDDSAADLALCNYLAFWTGNDAARIDRMFRQSKLYRDKWLRSARTGETYGAGTIARAIAATVKTYEPRVWADEQTSQIIDPDTGEITTLTKTRTYTNGSNGNGFHAEPVSDFDYAKGGNDMDEEYTEAPQAKKEKSELDPLLYRAEDGGVLDAWLDHYGDAWLFVVGPDKWHYWFNTHWMADDKLLVNGQIESLMDAMNQQCVAFIREAPGKIKAISEKYADADLEIPETAIREIERIKSKHAAAKEMHKATKRSSARISSVEIMARSKRGQSVNRMDTNESINLKNGVFNLRSLELFPHSPDDLFTYCLDYDYEPTADCPLFKKFISEVLVKEGTTDTDHDLVNLFQELLGYSLTPDVRREVMVWMFGEGGNGKSVAISVIEGLLGPMSMSIDFQTVGTPGNYDLADIPGKRVLFSTEAERNKFMAEGYIKRIVTGDTINARPIYGSTIRFKSTAKIWWSMNDKPLIRDTTDSMWRRMKLIPFWRKFEEGKNADPELTNKLLAELSGILNWAIDGLVRLKLNNKFTQSDAADEAKRQYREEANPVAQWVSTQTVPSAHYATLAGALFRNYMEWCHQQNEKPVTSTQFGKDLKRLKIESDRKGAGYMYKLALIEPHERENRENH